LSALYRICGYCREPAPARRYRYRRCTRFAVTICKSAFTLTVTAAGADDRARHGLPRVFPIAIGAHPDGADKQTEGDRRTPEGAFPICQKLRLAPPHGGFGTHWLRLDTRPRWEGIGIHGTNNPASLGTRASAGCIRMANADVAWLYRLLPLGTVVTITP
jgi:murein L,D-transpeptidase YafK